MAQEPPEAKKLKHSIIADQIDTVEFEELFGAHWHGRKELVDGSLQVIVEPFRVCKISNFLRSEEFMDEIKNELLDVKSRRNSIDLYQFEQTSDLANVDTKCLKSLYETIQTELATWMERNTNIRLNKKISLSSACYSDTDYLLCHDDNLGDRRIAFILYLSKNWTAEDGGALDLFDTDENGLPRNIVKSLIPEYNSLVFFEVVDNSYHQVAEVTSPDKSRWTINGWFHGPLPDSTRPSRPDLQLNLREPEPRDIVLDSWITNCYLHPGIIKEIQRDVEQESFAFLSNFVKADVYEKLLGELSSGAVTWTKVGPADIRNYEVAEEESLPDLLKNFYNLFKSISIFRLLKDYTELDLVPEKGKMNPRMTIELQRWSKGCYTLICDKSASSDVATANPKKSTTNDIHDHQGEGAGQASGGRSREAMHCPATSDSGGVAQSGRDSQQSNRDDGDEDEDEDAEAEAEAEADADAEDDQVIKKLQKGKSPRFKKKSNPSQQSSSSKLENASPLKPARNLDTDDSDVSDIGDYLSDPLDCSLECSEQEDDVEESNVAVAGALDVILQFHTGHVPEEDTIDYVDPREQEGALIHIPAKDNHLCLVYKTLGTCRLHKYVNHYCRGYFYNLMCTYYE